MWKFEVYLRGLNSIIRPNIKFKKIRCTHVCLQSESLYFKMKNNYLDSTIELA